MSDCLRCGLGARRFLLLSPSKGKGQFERVSSRNLYVLVHVLTSSRHDDKSAFVARSGGDTEVESYKHSSGVYLPCLTPSFLLLLDRSIPSGTPTMNPLGRSTKHTVIEAINNQRQLEAVKLFSACVKQTIHVIDAKRFFRS